MTSILNVFLLQFEALNKIFDLFIFLDLINYKFLKSSFE